MSVSLPSGLFTRNNRYEVGLGPADQAAADVRVAARPGVEPELADHLEAGDIREWLR